MMQSGRPLDTQYLEEYQGFILQHIRKKFEALDLRREVLEPDDAEEDDRTPTRHGGLGGGGMGGGRPAPADKKKDGAKKVGLVDWEQDNRENILKRFRWTRTPTSGTVKLAQEDLWVYEALLRIISNTNLKTVVDGKPIFYDYENLPVRKIHTLQIADQVSGMVITGGDGDADQTQGGDAMGGAESAKPAIDYPEGRYVDDRNRSLGPADPDPFAEYKIMPIRIELDIDQQMIPKLLAECDSSNMPVEVNRVRLNPGAGRRFNLNLAVEEGGDGSGGAGVGGTARMSEGSVRVDMYITIELLGVIYIYNPPDKNKLGTGTVAEEAAEEREEEEEEEKEETPSEETPQPADETAKTGPGQPSLVGG